MSVVVSIHINLNKAFQIVLWCRLVVIPLRSPVNNVKMTQRPRLCDELLL